MLSWSTWKQCPVSLFMARYHLSFFLGQLDCILCSITGKNIMQLLWIWYQKGSNCLSFCIWQHFGLNWYFKLDDKDIQHCPPDSQHETVSQRGIYLMRDRMELSSRERACPSIVWSSRVEPTLGISFWAWMRAWTFLTYLITAITVQCLCEIFKAV